MTETSIGAGWLELEPVPPAILPAQCMHAARQHGKPISAQLSEILKLSLGPNRLSKEDYYYYRLYDDALDMAAKREFVGRALEQLLHVLTCDSQWYAVAHDKLLFHGVLQAAGLPVPALRAVYGGRGGLEGCAAPADPAALATWLRQAPYPLFGKPATGIRSIGVARLDGYETADDVLRLAGGRQVPLAGFIEALAPFRGDGYLFQQAVVPHPEAKRLHGGQTLATVRLVLLLEEEGPQIFRALWKLPAGDNVADNFWRPGNIIALLDPASGRLLRALSGVGPALQELERHPDTGSPLIGAEVPCWAELTALCLRAARLFPHLRMQAWDVGIAADGPLLVELNIGGDYSLPQLAAGRGMLEPRFRSFLADCAERRGQQKAWRKLRLPA
ncbi:MAG TPA: sugar-transfer associated ATP-grasp domain-containing protein [Alphaproteobacteria bacterium]|nr:sugar-transfer associated ATP-grasp domain-containing protein [Alphaproteobacteria bacterium]